MLVNFYDLIFHIFKIILDTAVIDHHRLGFSVVALLTRFLDGLLLFTLEVHHNKVLFLAWVLVWLVDGSTFLVKQDELLLELSIILTSLHFWRLWWLVIRRFGRICFWAVTDISLTFHRLIRAAFICFKHISKINILLFHISHLNLAHIAGYAWVGVHYVVVSKVNAVVHVCFSLVVFRANVVVIGWDTVFLTTSFLYGLVRSTIDFHHVGDLISWTLSKLFNLTLTLMLNGVVSSLDSTRVHWLLVWSIGTSGHLYSWLRSAWSSTRSSDFSLITFLRVLHIFALNILKVHDFLLFFLAVNYNIEIFTVISLFVVTLGSFSFIFLLWLAIWSTWRHSWLWIVILIIAGPSGCPFFIYFLVLVFEILNLIGVDSLILALRTNIRICTLLASVVERIFLFRRLLLELETLLSFVIKLRLNLLFIVLTHSGVIHHILTLVHKVVFHNVSFPLFDPCISSYLGVINWLKLFRHRRLRCLLVFQSLLNFFRFKVNFGCWLYRPSFLRIFN